MLDHVPNHVRDPKGAIRSCASHNRPTPSIFTCEEIEIPFVGWADGLETDTCIRQNVMLNEVMKRLAGKGMRLRTGSKQKCVAIDHAATGGGESP